LYLIACGLSHAILLHNQREKDTGYLLSTRLHPSEFGDDYPSATVGTGINTVGISEPFKGVMCAVVSVRHIVVAPPQIGQLTSLFSGGPSISNFPPHLSQVFVVVSIRIYTPLHGRSRGKSVHHRHHKGRERRLSAFSVDSSFRRWL